jgi:DNA-binding response OmpR family regulator
MPRILIAEPYPEIRELLTHVVTNLGFEPVLMDAGQEQLPETDVMLLEPALPGGVELAQSLRKARPDLPIVCVGSDTATAEIVALAPVAYLLKPFALTALQTALEHAVERASIPA